MLKPLDILVTLKFAALEAKVAPARSIENPMATLARGVAKTSDEGPVPSTLAVRGLRRRPPMSFELLGESLGISASQAHGAAISAMESHLVGETFAVDSKALYEVLMAIKYFLPAQLGGPCRGTTTSFAAPVFRSGINYGLGQAPVWPHEGGKSAGLAVSPIYKTAPFAALKDERLYVLLALVDSLRLDRPRESELAKLELKSRLGLKF